jgi:hypothetical protein
MTSIRLKSAEEESKQIGDKGPYSYAHWKLSRTELKPFLAILHVRISDIPLHQATSIPPFDITFFDWSYKMETACMQCIIDSLSNKP